MPEQTPLSLLQLNQRIAGALATSPGLAAVWVMGETSDLRVSGGHCYMELLQKDDRGAIVARARAVIWSSRYARLAARFEAETGTRLRSDLKVLVRASVNYHPVFGLSLVIDSIDPSFTLGDQVRRRNEIIAQLKADGIYDLNHTIDWPVPATRIAVVSASQAAGYGDFTRHLLENPCHLRFSTELFPAVMQGEKAPASIIAALEGIMERIDDFDCVAIIRGGGAVSDLACFDDYLLSSVVAQFPLPVVVGIGHDRDYSVLDLVASARGKTPTDAAEYLVTRAASLLAQLVELGNAIKTAAAENIAGRRQQLEYFRGQIPALARAALVNASAALQRNSIGNIVALCRVALHNAAERLRPYSTAAISAAAEAVIQRRREQLASYSALLEALSPEATLKRGYSITRVDGRAVKNAADLQPGAMVTTIFANGQATSTVVDVNI